MITPEYQHFYCGIEDAQGRVKVYAGPRPFARPPMVAPYPHTSAMVHEGTPPILPTAPELVVLRWIPAKYATPDHYALAQHLAEVSYYERQARRCP